MANDIVRVFSAARMLAIEAQAIVQAWVEDDVLILERNNGEQLGPFNVRGPQGLQGIQGIQGIQGLKGDKGDKGDTGAQGPVGVTDTLNLEAALGVKRKATVSLISNQASRTGTPVLDAYQTVPLDSVLLLAQTTASQNGLWQIPADGGAWVRHPSANTTLKCSGMSVTVERGAVRGGKSYQTDWNGHVNTLDVSAMNFEPPHMKAYPVGSIFMATVATNPNTLLGWGTWSAWGVGRVPTGVDATQTEFNTVEKTGGSKTHTLTPGQLPAHGGQVVAHSSVSSWWDASGLFSSSVYNGTQYSAPGNIFGGASSVSVLRIGFGNNESHPILQPYITCYMWKRTA